MSPVLRTAALLLFGAAAACLKLTHDVPPGVPPIDAGAGSLVSNDGGTRGDSDTGRGCEGYSPGSGVKVPTACFDFGTQACMTDGLACAADADCPKCFGDATLDICVTNPVWRSVANCVCHTPGSPRTGATDCGLICEVFECK